MCLPQSSCADWQRGSLNLIKTNLEVYSGIIRYIDPSTDPGYPEVYLR